MIHFYQSNILGILLDYSIWEDCLYSKRNIGYLSGMEEEGFFESFLLIGIVFWYWFC